MTYIADMPQPLPLLPDLIKGGHDETLFAEAKRLREKFWGNNVFLRGIIEFSNYCRQNCLYCGLRRDNKNLNRYRLTPDEIFQTASEIKMLGINTVVLQSGEDTQYSGTDIARLTEKIKNGLGLAVTLSLGERGKSDYAVWKNAGADRYLLKVETFSETRHNALRPGATLARRLEALHNLICLDYECGSGLIGGLPEETPETLAFDLMRLAELKLDMISISPFTPHPDTPLYDKISYGAQETMRLMAIARLMTPSAHIPVTSALSLHGDNIRLQGLTIGDVIMPSLTPAEVRADYFIYSGKNRDSAPPVQRAQTIINTLTARGFTLPSGTG
ncbi:MAG: [FeFe] hydrogenase H-cluster radical SAM maturase HydE, partial [Deferribacteraceae bacterium]|nr:[FeFe] hydrogenase H-cluster radical SAM maturase HydE [Deferribacteraceae bacterium]